MKKNDGKREREAHLETPVLFLVFNRPDTTEKVFDAIRSARPPRLYVAADGPRANKEGELESVELVRDIATGVDWPCEVKTLFRERNLGCKKAVSEAIDWFFESEDMGIILEDDCLPDQGFFNFCDVLLHRYAKDERVWVITGCNFQNGIQRGDASYYFSRYNHVWGWASWRRAWMKRDMDIGFWPDWKQGKDWKNSLADPVERGYWTRIFDRMHRSEIDTWDYPWTASVWFNHGLTATPNVNMVSNIGFGLDATHTTAADSQLAAMSTSGMPYIMHPNEVALDYEADRYTFDNAFGGKNMRFPYSLLQKIRKIRKRVRAILSRLNLLGDFYQK